MTAAAVLVPVPVAAGRRGVAGALRLDPVLSRVELGYLVPFCESRRWNRPEGPYAVPGNPLAECADAALDLDAFVRAAPGQPSLCCCWRPRVDGTALEPVAAGPVAEVAGWLDYLLDHFIGPAARCRSLPAFGAFAAHRLTGAVAVAEPTGRLELVRVRQGRAVRSLVHPGRPSWGI